jgi:hypothetical protein
MQRDEASTFAYNTGTPIALVRRLLAAEAKVAELEARVVSLEGKEVSPPQE